MHGLIFQNLVFLFRLESHHSQGVNLKKEKKKERKERKEKMIETLEPFGCTYTYDTIWYTAVAVSYCVSLIIVTTRHIFIKSSKRDTL